MAESGRSRSRRFGWIVGGVIVLCAAVVAVIVVSVGHHSSAAPQAAAVSDPHPGSDVRSSPARTPASPAPRATSVASLGLQRVVGPAAGPSGVPLPTGNPPGWRRVYADSFPASQATPLGSFSGCRWATPPTASFCSGLTGAARRNWFAEPSHAELSTGDFQPDQVLSINGGELRFALRGKSNGQPYLAAAIPRIAVGGQLGAFKSGLFVMRFRSDAVPGYDVAFELWPVSRDWRDGGVQFPAGFVDGPIQAIVGQVGVPYGNPDLVMSTNRQFTRWHTATIEWRAGTVRFLLDGRQVGTTQPFHPLSPLRWYLFAGPPDNAAASTRGKSGTLRVAWLAAYVPDAADARTR